MYMWACRRRRSRAACTSCRAATTTTTTCRWALAELAVVASCSLLAYRQSGGRQLLLRPLPRLAQCTGCGLLPQLPASGTPLNLEPSLPAASSRLFRTSLTTVAGAAPTARCRRSARGGCWVGAGCTHSLCSACCALLAAALESPQLHPGIDSSCAHNKNGGTVLLVLGNSTRPAPSPPYHPLTYAHRYARQHYTSRAPPSHREIQAALVQIGDKEPSFIGSK